MVASTAQIPKNRLSELYARKSLCKKQAFSGKLERFQKGTKKPASPLFISTRGLFNVLNALIEQPALAEVIDNDAEDALAVSVEIGAVEIKSGRADVPAAVELFS